MRTRVFLIGLVALTVATLAVVAVGLVHDRPSEASGPTVEPDRPAVGDRADALTVLRRWDLRRARAWASADPAAVSALYVPRSRSGARDVALLRRYVRRGLRVTGLRMQIFDIRVRRHAPARLSLVATDRLVDAVVAGHGRRQVLPQDRPSVRRIDLRRRAGRWVVVEAWDVARRAQPAR